MNSSTAHNAGSGQFQRMVRRPNVKVSLTNSQAKTLWTMLDQAVCGAQTKRQEIRWLTLRDKFKAAERRHERRRRANKTEGIKDGT